MKTKTLIAGIFFLFCIGKSLHSQNLNNKIKKSVVNIGETFTDIPLERLLYLDQIAFLTVKQVERNQMANLLFIDANNSLKSQLALIWLQTGIVYYGHFDKLSIQSAGVEILPTAPLNFDSLKEFGFNLKVSDENETRLDYGSGYWQLFPKEINSIKTEENTLTIYLEEGILPKKDKNNIELYFSNPDDIPREMLYLATRINNLLTQKNKE